MTNKLMKLTTVTPMFLAGADNETPELRAASLRGELRYWLRAALGAQVENDLDALHTLERLVFGDTSLASPVIIQMEGSFKPVTQRVLPHNPNKSFTKRAIPKATIFQVRLRPRLGQREIPMGAIQALELLIAFGGLGKRARRGFGSLQLQGDLPADGTALIERFQATLNAARSWAHPSGAPWTASSWPQYPVLAVPHVAILVCEQPFTDAEAAMLAFWGKLRASPYRSQERAFGHASGGRCASPLHLHIAHSQQGYHLVLTAFRWTPGPSLGVPGWALVDQFLAEASRTWKGTYLIGGVGQW